MVGHRAVVGMASIRVNVLHCHTGQRGQDMAKTATLTLRVSEELKNKLGRFAEQTNRTPSSVAERTLETFLDRELEMMAAVDQGLEDFRLGRTVPHDEAMRRIRATLDKHKKRP
jgi:predicted transcriptional regulator